MNKKKGKKRTKRIVWTKKQCKYYTMLWTFAYIVFIYVILSLISGKKYALSVFHIFSSIYIVYQNPRKPRCGAVNLILGYFIFCFFLPLVCLFFRSIAREWPYEDRGPMLIYVCCDLLLMKWRLIKSGFGWAMGRTNNMWRRGS
jgi:hypothetical protein